MNERETVQCSDGPACGSLHADHHGWDCPLSDPLGDTLRAMGERPTNPILAASWQGMQDRWLGLEPDPVRPVRDFVRLTGDPVPYPDVIARALKAHHARIDWILTVATARSGSFWPLWVGRRLAEARR